MHEDLLGPTQDHHVGLAWTLLGLRNRYLVPCSVCGAKTARGAASTAPTQYLGLVPSDQA